MSVIRRATTSEIKRIDPNQVGKAPPGQAKKPIHHINQLRPEGADKDYANGLFNCGPAAVAMVARSAGKMGHLNDAQLVSELGKGVVTEKGSSPEGIATMMARAGVAPDGDALGAGYTDAQLQAHLGKGNKMIAQVRSSNPDSQNDDSAHYVVIEGQTRNGNYIVSDPLAKGPYVVTPKQLKDAVLKAPPDGGMLIPVANPAGQAATANGLTRPTVDGVEVAGEPIEALSTNPSLAAVQGVDSFVTAAAPEPAAFTATAESLKGVDTEFKETGSKPTDKLLAQNEQRNTFELEVNYSKPSLGERIKRAVTSAVDNVKDFIKNLFQLKSKGDAKAYETLSKLEASKFKEDKAALEEIAKSDKKDPGTGVKIQGDAF